MTKDSKKGISLNFLKPSSEFFDRIILAIKREKELRQARKLLFAFVFLLLVSVVSAPFSTMLLINQWQSSGVFYFITAAFRNLDIFFGHWTDFTLSIFESLPVIPIVVFSINVALLLFTVRLFIYRKGLLIKYLRNNFA